MSEISREEFVELLIPVVESISDKQLNKKLEEELNTSFPANGDVFRNIEKACENAIAAGWMCKYEGGGIRYGRVVKPGTGLGRFSVDVVDMKDLKGPHHSHPQGEIDMIMPLDETAKFDSAGKGWLVYEAGSAHSPTVTDGNALVLYLLPDGEIEFS